MQSKDSKGLLAGIVIGIVIGFVFSRVLPSTASKSFDGTVIRNSQTPNAFFLGVAVHFTHAKDKAEFKNIFKPLADYVTNHEGGTVSYQYSESDKDPLRVFILERYKDKDVAFMKVHRSSPAFMKFRALMAKMQDTKQISLVDGHSYVEDSALGFV